MCSISECVLFYTSHSARKILDRVLRSAKKFSRSLCRRISCLASGHPLRRLLIQSSAVSLSKFKMLTIWYRVGSTSCILNNSPMVPKLRLPLLQASCCGGFRGQPATLSQLIMVSYVRLFSCMDSRLSPSLLHPSAQPSKFVFSAFRKWCFASWYPLPSSLRRLARPPVLICHCNPHQRINVSFERVVLCGL